MIDPTIPYGYGACGIAFRSCADRNIYQYTSPVIPDKEWAVAVQKTPQDLNSVLGKSIRYINVTIKDRLCEYRFAHNKWIVQMNTARSFELERECYNEAAPFLIRARRERLMAISRYIIFNIVRERVKEIVDPKQKFVPSEQLVDLIYRHMLRPDKGEISHFVSEISSIRTNTGNEKEIVKGIVIDQVENLMTSMAKRIARDNEKKIDVTSDNRFTPEVCKELIDRLGLDIYEAPSILKLFYEEFLDFASSIPRERVWGNIFVENGVLKLEVKKNLFTLPKFPRIGDGGWLVT